MACNFQLQTSLVNSSVHYKDNWSAGNGHDQRVTLTEQSYFIYYFSFPFCVSEMNELGNKILPQYRIALKIIATKLNSELAELAYYSPET